ncbi:hypothetical protein HHK36_023790 [Tetracentron sinense]|uniref:Zinc finger CCCH domain-containing protein 13 n=1 Tax=Tetracentron sinense TaxID=13715 RepID=A0A834YQT7_TETSI|nr:hypothetical protein HHK36_023790 [Tetracentron sinense]
MEKITENLPGDGNGSGWRRRRQWMATETAVNENRDGEGKLGACIHKRCLKESFSRRRSAYCTGEVTVRVRAARLPMEMRSLGGSLVPLTIISRFSEYPSVFCSKFCSLCNGGAHGRRDYRGNALRDKFEGRDSPQRRYSPGRYAKGRHAFHGLSPSRSPEKRSEKKQRKKQHLDGQSDFTRNLKTSEGAEDRVEEKKRVSYDSRDVLEDQLKQVQLDIDMLDDHKGQLEIDLEEKVQAAVSLTSRIEELETQLNKEQEDYKRSQARLQRLGDQLDSDASRLGANEEDSSVNIVSDGEPNDKNRISPWSELKNHASPSKKRLRINLGATEEAKLDSRKREGFLAGTVRLEKTQWDGPPAQSDKNNKEAETVNKILIGSNGRRPLTKEDKYKRGKNDSPGIPSVDKLKSSEMGPVLLPSTSMAANAVDEPNEVIEMEEKIEVVETASRAVEKGNTDEIAGLPFMLPPPPPVPKYAYNQHFNMVLQYEGADEDVDVDVEQLDEMGGLDLNSEVDIEQL